MEWAVDLESQVFVQPRGQTRESTGPNGKKGLSWTSKYGFGAINAYGLDVAMDGVNEVGLSVGFLWLPGTKYQKVGAGEEDKAISILDFGTWLLGNFATVEEVKNAVQQVRVWGKVVPQMKGIPTLQVVV